MTAASQGDNAPLHLRPVITCEHGGRHVPAEHRRLFRGRRDLLASHRGYDRGSRGIARELARRLDAPLHLSRVTRLLVDLNRSRTSPSLLSEVTRDLAPSARRRLLAEHYEPYRREVEGRIRREARRGAVLHVSVHTFTPVLDGKVRTVDVGLLDDPRRAPERSFTKRWRRELAARLPGFRIALNRPYRGTADGFTTALRRRFPPERYLGLELEVNQKHVDDPVAAREVARAIARALAAAIASGGAPGDSGHAAGRRADGRGV